MSSDLLVACTGTNGVRRRAARSACAAAARARVRICAVALAAAVASGGCTAIRDSARGLAPAAAAGETPAPAAPAASAALAGSTQSGGSVDPSVRESWPVLRGATLKLTVEIWAKHSVCAAAPQRNWTVIWKARSAYAIEAPHDVPGNLGFADAANTLLATYSRFASPPIDWTIWTGNCAVVVNDRPEGEGNDAR